MSAVPARLGRLTRRALKVVGCRGLFYRVQERAIAAGAGPWPEVAVDGLPAPPPPLVATVVGDVDLDGFPSDGHAIAAFLTELAERHGASLSTGQVLDFGCGCGRVARVLAPAATAADGGYTGCDINVELVRWCDRAPPGRYVVNRLAPHAPLPDAAFDTLFAISVLTHMPQTRMRAWLADFHRMLTPGGVALVSFADEARAELSDAERPDAPLTPALSRDGFAASTRTLEGSNFMSSYATVAAFTVMAAERFEVLEVLASPQTGQSLAWSVLRRPSAPQSWSGAPSGNSGR